jgi:hypothetical protein
LNHYYLSSTINFITTFLLFLVPIFVTMAIIYYLPLAPGDEWSQMTGEAHLWVPAVCQMV